MSMLGVTELMAHMCVIWVSIENLKTNYMGLKYIVWHTHSETHTHTHFQLIDSKLSFGHGMAPTALKVVEISLVHSTEDHSALLPHLHSFLPTL